MRSDVVESHPSSNTYVRRPQPPFMQYPPGPQMPHPQGRSSTTRTNRPRRRLTLIPTEGWSSLILLAIAVYCIIFAIISANWVSNTTVLLWTTGIGLLVGFAVAKSRRLPQAILHIGACLLGYWLSVFLTSAAFHISWMELLANLRLVLTGGMSSIATSTGIIIFLFYLSFLSFFLGYFGAWLTFRAHLPWLVAFVYTSILMVNLNYIKKDLSYLIIILLAALILLVARIQLVAQLSQWVSEGLHTDTTWVRSITTRLMRFTSIVMVITILLAWILPIMAQPSAGTTFWDRMNNIWSNISHGHITWNDPAGLLSPFQSPTDFFGDQLSITGNVNLPTGDVLYYTSSEAPQYLQGFTYDHFDGHTWTTTYNGGYNGDPTNYDAKVSLPTDPVGHKQISTTVTIAQPPENTKHFLFAPPQPASFSVPTALYSNGAITAWTQQSPLYQNEKYTVTSFLSSATTADLSTVPLPSESPNYWREDSNYNVLQSAYLEQPNDLSANVLKTLQQWTAGATTTYGAVKLIEIHLSDTAQFTYSLSNPPVPDNVDAIDWLLQTHRGYCTYYATAMTIMVRMLGIPARIVNGFSHGNFDQRNGHWTITGTDAHSWVQVYFPNYGWIDFEPTPGFTLNNIAGAQPQPTPLQTPAATHTPTAQPTPSKTGTPTHPTPQASSTATKSTGGTPSANTTGFQPSEGLLLGLTIVAFICALIFLLLAIGRYWWRNLFAGSSFVAGIYLRICRLASWAGITPEASQTPYEYSGILTEHFPEQARPLWRLTDLYVHERYARPGERPYNTENAEIARFWHTLRGKLIGTLLLRPFRWRRGEKSENEG